VAQPLEDGLCTGDELFRRADVRGVPSRLGRERVEDTEDELQQGNIRRAHVRVLGLELLQELPHEAQREVGLLGGRVAKLRRQLSRLALSEQPQPCNARVERPPRRALATSRSNEGSSLRSAALQTSSSMTALYSCRGTKAFSVAMTSSLPRSPAMSTPRLLGVSLASR
jgi:hypothetical protein